MPEQLKTILEMLAAGAAKLFEGLSRMVAALWLSLGRHKRPLIILGALFFGGQALCKHPPVENLESGEIGFRENRIFGGTEQFAAGPVFILPGLHELRRYSLRDRVYRPEESSSASGEAPFQSIEGLSVGVDLSIRYALDPGRLAAIAKQLPDDIDHEVVQPAVQGVVYRILARYTVKEIFSTKRAAIQEEIQTELKPRLVADGVLLRGVQMGKVDLPGDYRQGMEKLLAEELETEKMKYTIELKDKQVKVAQLEADAEKVRREKAAEAAGNEEIIAAKAQAEAMKHVLPFKQKQIEQRRLEAEAEKQARVKTAEATADARRIEAAGEADSRRKLADAESYRMEQVGKVNSALLESDGAVLSRHPLLIQKIMAEKLSDKVQVIIAPPNANGFIASGLLGQGSGKGSE